MQKTSFNSGYLFAALTVAIWAGFIVISRLGGTSLLTAFDVAALRFGAASLALLPFWWMRRASVKLFNRRNAALALTGGVGYALLAYSGFKLAPAAHAAVLMPGVLPFQIALCAWLLLGERPNGTRWLALLLIAAGVMCLAVDVFQGGQIAWAGDLLFLSASASWALYTVLGRRWAADPWDATIAVTVLATLVYLPIYLLFLPKHLAVVSGAALITQALYQGVIVAVVAMLLYMKALVKIGPTRLGTFMAAVPASAGLISAPLLGEALSPWMIAGLLCVSIGAWIGSRYSRVVWLTTELKRDEGLT